MITNSMPLVCLEVSRLFCERAVAADAKCKASPIIAITRRRRKKDRRPTPDADPGLGVGTMKKWARPREGIIKIGD